MSDIDPPETAAREEITRIRAQPRPAIEAPRAITRLTNRRRTVEL